MREAERRDPRCHRHRRRLGLKGLGNPSPWVASEEMTLHARYLNVHLIVKGGITRLHYICMNMYTLHMTMRVWLCVHVDTLPHARRDFTTIKIRAAGKTRQQLCEMLKEEIPRPRECICACPSRGSEGKEIQEPTSLTPRASFPAPLRWPQSSSYAQITTIQRNIDGEIQNLLPRAHEDKESHEMINFIHKMKIWDPKYCLI
jgi:hypothetical protein